MDRPAGEPQVPSASLLSSLVAENDYIDVWRQLNSTVRQYTWVKVTDSKVSAARLDRVYLDKKHQNWLMESTVGFLDHHIVTVVLYLLVRHQRCPCWQFNVRLVRDEAFCRAFSEF